MLIAYCPWSLLSALTGHNLNFVNSHQGMHIPGAVWDCGLTNLISKNFWHPLVVVCERKYTHMRVQIIIVLSIPNKHIHCDELHYSHPTVHLTLHLSMILYK